MSDFHRFNPFARRDAHGTGAVTSYKVLTIVSWLLNVITSVYYSAYQPHDGHRIRQRIWDLNYIYPTGFTVDATIVEIFWAVTFALQIGYISALFSRTTETVHHAASIGSHFILNNLLQFAFVLLFVHSHFVLSELVLIINFFNLSSLYFRHNTYSRWLHIPVVAAPLAWTFVALYWNGALLVHHPHHLVPRIFANVFIWAILVYGMFFIVIYKDWSMGGSLAILSAAVGVAQFFDKTIALQWIFAFTIMAVLFVMTLVVAVPAWQGREMRWRRVPPADTERAPLLAD